MNSLYLARRYPRSALKKVLVPRDEWRPYPRRQERKEWESLPEAPVRRIVHAAETFARAPWPDLSAGLYLEFARTGDREKFQEPYFHRRDALGAMVLAECAEAKGRFIDRIADAAWSISEESSWCLPAHVGAQKAGRGLPDAAEPIVDLFAAETAAFLSWTRYLLGPELDAVSPLIRSRMEREIRQRVLEPAFRRDDFQWMGLGKNTESRGVNNWNPWICSNWLASVLLIEQDQALRAMTVHKILKCLDVFLSCQSPDGGCDEGPGYWGRAGGSLFDCLETLHDATGSRIDVFDSPLIAEIGRFIRRAHVDSGYFVNFADASAMPRVDGPLVFRFGKRIGDGKMAGFGAWMAKRGDAFGTERDLGRWLAELFCGRELDRVRAEPALERDVWLPGLEVMAARRAPGSASGLFVAAKGGHNDESHNHNDVGHFIVFKDGKPLIVDAGVGVYTAKTFGPERYAIWTMQSAFHSLPTIGGIMQAAGRDFSSRNVAYVSDDAAVRFSLDIAAAYPREAGLEAWVREIVLLRKDRVEITDAYRFRGLARDIVMSLLTPCETDLGTPGLVRLRERELPEGRRTGNGEIVFDPKTLQASVEPIPLDDARLSAVWGDRLARVLLRVVEPLREGEFSVTIR